jgi:RluA family pseudouridine synthase
MPQQRRFTHHRRPDRRRPNTSALRSFALLHEDAHIAVVAKPDGLLVDMADNDEQTLQDQVRKHLPPSNEPDAVAPAAVHRLDRYTSGVVLFGRTTRGLDGLSALWRSGGIEKTYYALAVGHPARRTGAESGVIDAPIDDSEAPQRPVRVIRDTDPVDPDAPSAGFGFGARSPLEAVTRWKIAETLHWSAMNLSFTLLELMPLTGRTHQIRAHLAFAGSPVAGDMIYGDKGVNRALRERANLLRQFLHARSLRFAHPVLNKGINVTAKLPGDLLTVLRFLRAQGNR